MKLPCQQYRLRSRGSLGTSLATYSYLVNLLHRYVLPTVEQYLKKKLSWMFLDTKYQLC